MVLNPYLANLPILYPLNSFLVFSGGIKWKHRSKMGQVSCFQSLVKSFLTVIPKHLSLLVY